MKKMMVALVLLCAGGALMAEAQTRDCAALTRQALEISGVNQYMDQLSSMAQSSPFLAAIAGENATQSEVASILQPILQKHLEAAQLRKEMQERMAARCNAEQMTRTVETMQSPLVSRMLVMETAGNAPDAREKTERYARAIRLAPPPDSRIDAVEAIDASAGVTDHVVDMILAFGRGMMTGTDAHPDEIDQIAQRRKELKSQLHGGVQLSLLSTYRSATVPELLQYAKELRVAPLHTFYGQVNQTVAEIFEEHARDIGRDMKAAVIASRGKNP
jgi:hypothetical protein